jgi:integrase
MVRDHHPPTRIGKTTVATFGMGLHDLRHTCASLAISSGANVKVVQRLPGHKTAVLTLDRYRSNWTLWSIWTEGLAGFWPDRTDVEAVSGW